MSVLSSATIARPSAWAWATSGEMSIGRPLSDGRRSGPHEVRGDVENDRRRREGARRAAASMVGVGLDNKGTRV